MLRRLSVVPSWSLDMAEQVCADDSLPMTDIVDLLTALVDKSLIELEPEVLGEARYRLLETVREYAAGWLARGETAVIERRRREYALREAEKAAAVGMAMEPLPGRPGWTRSGASRSRRRTCTRSLAAACPMATPRQGCGSAPGSGWSGSCGHIRRRRSLD